MFLPILSTTVSYDQQSAAPPDDRMGDMDQDDMMSGGGRDSPLKPSSGMDVSEDILAKLRHQVSSASIFGHHGNHINHINNRDSGNGPTSPGSPTNVYSHAHLHNNNNIHNNGHTNIYDRLQSLLQNKMKREGDMDNEEDAREMAFRAEEILLRQREALLSSPHSLINAMRGGPPSLVPPSSHIPFLPTSVGLPPSTQMPPTPGSAGSRDSSSGNGNRTPSHSPEPSQSQQPWSFEEQFKQGRSDDFALTDSADSPRVREPAKHSSFEEDKRKVGKSDLTPLSYSSSHLNSPIDPSAEMKICWCEERSKKEARVALKAVQLI